MNDNATPTPPEQQAAAATPAAPEPSEFVVEIPGQRPDERTLLAVPDEQTAQEVRHLVNGFRRREEVERERARLEGWAAALRVVEAELAINPAGVRGLAVLLAEEILLARAGGQVEDDPPAPSAEAQPPLPARRVVARRVR